MIRQANVYVQSRMENHAPMDATAVAKRAAMKNVSMDAISKANARVWIHAKMAAMKRGLANVRMDVLTVLMMVHVNVRSHATTDVMQLVSRAVTRTARMDVIRQENVFAQ